MQDPSRASDDKYRAIKLHGPLDFQGMRQAGRLAAETLDFLTPYVKPGVHRGIGPALSRFYSGAWRDPGTARLQGLSKVYLHLHQPCRMPWDSGPRKLENGDILNIDVTVILNGWHGDTSRMFGVGKVGVKRAD